MTRIVWAGCASHTAAMLRMPEGTDAGQAQRVFGAFDSLRASLIAARPDVLVVIATDHMMTFSYEAVPVFAVGTGDRFPSWGEAGTPKRVFQGVDELGDSVVGALVGDGFDVVSMAAMRLDHGFSCPLTFILKEIEIPILPVYVNCTVPPLPSHQRCRNFGQALGRALHSQTFAPRVAIVGTGGISHWVGTPKTGLINEEFDHSFMNMIVAGDLDAMTNLDSATVIAEAGNGAAEIRNWIVAAAASGSPPATRLAYEPVGAWKTGIGLAQFSLGE